MQRGRSRIRHFTEHPSQLRNTHRVLDTGIVAGVRAKAVAVGQRRVTGADKGPAAGADTGRAEYCQVTRVKALDELVARIAKAARSGAHMSGEPLYASCCKLLQAARTRLG